MKEREHNQAKSELPSAQQTLLTAEDLWNKLMTVIGMNW